MPSDNSSASLPTRSASIEVIAFDADDTLWHTETLFVFTQEQFKALLAPYQDPAWIERRLFETEVRNLELFGYGIKGFTLSMIETAIELSGGRVGAREIQQIIDAGRAMLRAPVDLLPGVRRTLLELSRRYRLWLVTKGDLFDQESKIARSGIADSFEHIDIVSHKTPETYRRLLGARGLAPEQFLMVGNSLRSDVLPVVEIGARALHVPYHLTWQHEAVAAEQADGDGYEVLAEIAEVSGWLARDRVDEAAD